MEISREAFARIKEALKTKPRGMNINEISKEIGINRLTVAKYLEMLVLTGQVDVKKFGPSKVYYLSHRLPISAMLSLSSDFIIILDKNLRLVYANDRFFEESGIRREDILYKNIEIIENYRFPVSVRPFIKSYIKNAIEGKESLVEVQYQKEKMHYLEIKFIPMVFDDGEKGVTIIIENITDRKRAEEALKESEERFHATFEQAAVGMAHLDAEGRFIRLNQKYCDILGYTHEEIAGKTFLSITYPDDVQISEKHFNELKSGKINSYSFEKRYIKKDGSPVWANATVSAVRKPDGSIKYVIAVVEDISARKHAEEELKKARDELDRRVKERTLELEVANKALISEIGQRVRSDEPLRVGEDKYRSIVENVPDGVWEIDKDEVFVYASPRILDILGYSPEEVIGKSPYDFMPKASRNKVRREVRKMLEKEDGFKLVECDLLHKDGRKIRVEISIRPIFDSNVGGGGKRKGKD
ncbi:putative PAS sensor signal transduction histidine kinase [Methanocella conradii HZ254]|uniref:PAS sensor signal transduction histidine kinase n=1 Tax=Methanocella conradii (strain DSM 24694 / JCM 17849 / CGMCC 1.5162 / HZ254) TaxID=1041930 RepID=H8I9J3_METCZ|nr:PAS domain S-box protein [Methanocella conradii]AFD00038.1 putative PAS sensor signal transduction histidine kinase [Methanocella conradii HZ254]